MAIDYRVTTALAVGEEGQLFSQTATVSAGNDDRINEDLSVGANTLTFGSDVSQLKAIVMSLDAAGTLVLRSTSTPTQTITLTSDVPFAWVYGSGITNPLSADFNNLIATVGAESTLQIFKSEDPTV